MYVLVRVCAYGSIYQHIRPLSFSLIFFGGALYLYIKYNMFETKFFYGTYVCVKWLKRNKDVVQDYLVISILGVYNRSTNLRKFFAWLAVCIRNSLLSDRHLVLWHINHCRLFNAESCFYIYIKYMICKLILQIHTVKSLNSSISNNSVLHKSKLNSSKYYN